MNGATGIIQRIEYGTRNEIQTRVPCILWIEFDDPTVGKEMRGNFKACYLRDSTILRAGYRLDWKRDVFNEGRELL